MEILSDIVKIQKEFARCAKDPFYFATNFVYTFDQAKGERALFPKWDYLEYILDVINQPGDLFLEKSRDMVVSWTVMVHFLHSMLFKGNWAGFAISRKQAEVDDGGDNSTPESLFGRIKFMYSHLPSWMKPAFSFSLLKIKNLEGESYCTGESANPNSGRNVACTFKFCDEFAFLPINDQDSINGAMRFGSYRTLLYVTTAKPGTLAEKISKQGMDFEKIEIPWNLRPDKDAAWYEKKSKGSDKAAVAAELDISYSQSDESIIIGQFWDSVRHTIDATELPAISAYDEIICGMDYGYLRTAVEIGGLYKNCWYIFKELYEIEKTVAEIGELLQHLRSFLGVDFPIFCGKDRPDLIDEVQLHGFVVTGFKEPVGVRLGTLISVFKAERLRVINEAAGLLAEIPKYRRHIVGGMLSEVPHRHGVDEAMDALGYLLMGAGETSDSDLWVSDWSSAEDFSSWVSENWSSDFSKLRWIHER